MHVDRSRFLALGGISLALGLLVVSFYVYRDLQSTRGKSDQPMADALVAAKDLEGGTRLQASDIKIVRVPVSALPPDSPRKTADVIGQTVIHLIAKGQFILSAQFAGENTGSGLPSLIPPGMRAVSVQVTSATGFISPGTRVNVLMTRGANGEQRPVTVLQNVAVLAMGLRLDVQFRSDVVAKVGLGFSLPRQLHPVAPRIEALLPAQVIYNEPSALSSVG